MHGVVGGTGKGKFHRWLMLTVWVVPLVRPSSLRFVSLLELGYWMLLGEKAWQGREQLSVVGLDCARLGIVWIIRAIMVSKVFYLFEYYKTML
jgi:hypothetical protein